MLLLKFKSKFNKIKKKKQTLTFLSHMESAELLHMVDGCCTGPHGASPPRTGVLLGSSPLEGQQCEWRQRSEGLSLHLKSNSGFRPQSLKGQACLSFASLWLEQSPAQRSSRFISEELSWPPGAHTCAYKLAHYDHTLTHVPKHTRVCVLSHFSCVRVSETL